MTIQDQIDQLKKEFDEKIMQIKNEVTLLTGFTGGNHQELKPTRYYPNGAYMDEPENNVTYFFILDGEVTDSTLKWGNRVRVHSQNCFPTREAAEKELERQRLTAKMYRDMRDERINGDWDINFEDRLKFSEEKFYPYLEENRIDYIETYTDNYPHNFYYKNETFIKDLKAMGWTEEELKIVWFNN